MDWSMVKPTECQSSGLKIIYTNKRDSGRVDQSVYRHAVTLAEDSVHK